MVDENREFVKRGVEAINVRRSQQAEKFLSDAECFFDQKIELAKFTLTGLASLYGLMLAGIPTFLDKIHSSPIHQKIFVAISFCAVSLALVRISYYLAILPMSRFIVTLSNWERLIDEVSKDLEQLTKLIPDFDKIKLDEGVSVKGVNWINDIREQIKSDGKQYLSVLNWGIVALVILDALIVFMIFGV